MQTTNVLALVVAGLAARKGQWRDIAEGTGVPYDTVTKIAQGKTENPKIQSLQPLYDWIVAHPLPVDDLTARHEARAD
jgi:hypothetical protein